MRIKMLFTLFCVCLYSNLGCQQLKRSPNDTPVTNDARVIYTSVLQALTDLKIAGYITQDEKVNKIEPIRKQVIQALDDMEQAELAGNSVDASKKIFNAVLDQLIAWQTTANNRKASKQKVGSVNNVHHLVWNSITRYAA
jgi:hypothetical protein